MEQIVIYLLVVQEDFSKWYISKDFSVDNMKKNGLNGYLYNFRFNYDAITVADILDIPKYLMKKYDIKYWLSLLKKCLL